MQNKPIIKEKIIPKKLSFIVSQAAVKKAGA